MKRILSIVLLLALALTLCACGSRANTASAPAPAQESPAQAEEPAPTEEPAPDPAEKLAEAEALLQSGDYEQALALLRELYADDVPGAAAALGKCLYLGLGCEVDYDRAVHALEQAAAEGSVYSRYLLADAADNGNGTKQDKDEAAKQFVKFAGLADELDKDDPEYGPCMAALCELYARGRGVEQSDRLAADAADKAVTASGLNVFDRLALASFLEGDSRSAADRARATTLYEGAEKELRKLADAGNLRAMTLLGNLYLDGKGGVSKDYDKALSLFTEAGELGDADAQAQVAYMYQNALGVEADYSKAMEWNNRAILQGNAQAQAQLGYMYHMGLGVTRNLDTAASWYTKAAAGGSEFAKKMLEETEVSNPHAYFEAHA